MSDLETSGTLETPSGKAAADENFPVGSWLIRADLRRHVHALYRFARAADDIADNADLAADDKVVRLARMAEIVTARPTFDSAGGASGSAAELAASPSAVAMRGSLAESGVTAQHSVDLLAAFTQDATKRRYASWDELIAYCLLSAAPVGRHLLDLHGEGAACRPAADALCNALQVINHLQDCAADYRELDRVYLPQDMLAACGASTEDLAAPRLTPGLRRTLDRVIVPTQALLDQCADLVALVDDPRMALECAVIRAMAMRITDLLRHGDPLATRVALSKPRMAMTAFGAMAAGLWRRRRHTGRASLASVP
ncbi:MAG TPA: squalene synthase HpnC [Stellaceae bacterium]|nr:squalene synthase HpnC [Stellaceae bacterium]